jgi:RNA polymerase sigma-70 factor (ECF subfamily)
MGLHLLFGQGTSIRREIERSRDMLCRIAYAWCHDAALADDLAQSAIEKALRASGQLRDASRVKAWLLQILANCLRDHVRARREHVDLESVEGVLASNDATPEEAHESAQLAARVRAAVEKLPLGQRQVVTLVDLEECSYSEAGEILEIPIGTVMSRLCRARRALRDELDPAADEAAGKRLRSVK